MTSKFKYTAYVSVLYLVFVVLIIFWHVSIFKSVFTTVPGGKFVYIIAAIGVLSLYNSFRTKIVAVSFDDYSLTVKRYFGFGKPHKYFLNDITGYFTSSVWGRYSRHEYIYIMAGTKKVAKISEQYHSNFNEIRPYIQRRLVYLGNLETNVITDLVDFTN
ncbi:hypothetical protein FMM05_14490 [Flavobacterium zepuense]|uniref:Uncharacterized protein n=1 Tax=Flavobacterium zepuense TaxID=2593302 RepID=A0A552UYV2_9FLAO|nr:hypothetical protein [Flavobacterium zepuense]TRW23397.1 hypothetical protein FMM05_14490 [Flavobacterium zepuense]